MRGDMSDNFRSQIENQLKELNAEQIAQFAWRCALRVLPYLAAHGNFDFWVAESREKHLYAILRLFDIQSNFASTEAATEAAFDEAVEALFNAEKAFTSLREFAEGAAKVASDAAVKAKISQKAASRLANAAEEAFSENYYNMYFHGGPDPWTTDSTADARELAEEAAAVARSDNEMAASRAKDAGIFAKATAAHRAAVAAAAVRISVSKAEANTGGTIHRASIAAVAAREVVNNDTTIFADIMTVKTGNEGMAIPLNRVGTAWRQFSSALASLDCGYWVAVIEQWFANGGMVDAEASKRRWKIPPEVREQGASAAGAYLEVLEAGATRLNEARIIILGEKGAGKTCLARRLRDPDAPMTSPEESTAGVDTSVWQLQDNVNIRIWDFAGHTVTHAVHKFFLSERCLYVLVYDGRTEQNQRLIYWLDHVKNYGGKSDVIILVNTRDDHRPDIPINALKEKYPILDVVFLNIEQDEDKLWNFRDDIAEYIINRASWNIANFPTSYDHVKERLAQLFDTETGDGDSEFIHKEKFDEIAIKNGVKDTTELLAVLHDLGISLWYKNLVRYNTLVLNPEWISQGVYQIINFVHQKTSRGMIRFAEFRDVYHFNLQRYPVSKHEFLFELMKHYELAYETHCDKCLVIPHLLDEDQPAKLPDFPLGEALMLRYRSDLELPPDTISRFIVRHNEQIKNDEEKPVWRHGVILDDGRGTVALVREKDRTIEVSVKGRHKTEYIDVLRSTLNDVFNSYQSDRPELEYRVERYGDESQKIDKRAAIWLQDDQVLSQALADEPYYDHRTGKRIPMGPVVNIFKIERGNVLSGSGYIHAIDNSTTNTFNFENCSVALQGNLNELARSLVNEGNAKDAQEIKNASELLRKLESCDDSMVVKRTGLAAKLQRIVNELNNKKSKLHKTVKKIKNGVEIAQDIAQSYNDIAGWIGLPSVPKPFLNLEKTGTVIAMLTRSALLALANEVSKKWAPHQPTRNRL